MKDIDKDHVIPKILSGNIPELKEVIDKVDNYQLLHQLCHRVKSVQFDNWNKNFKRYINIVLKFNENIDKPIAHCITLILMNEAKLLDFLATNRQAKSTLKNLISKARVILALGKTKKIASMKLNLPDIESHFKDKNNK